MKLKLIKLGAVLIACAAFVPISSQAVPVFTTTGSETIGFVTPGTDTPTVDNSAYVNSLVDRNNGSATSAFDIAGQTYTLSHPAGTFGTLLLSDAVGADTGAVGGDNTVTVTGFNYLVVKYDGANGEAYVFNVVGITGDVTVPADDGDKTHSANKYLLFNAASTTPIPPGSAVPDGGNTALLLGLGFVAMGFVARRTGLLA